MDRTSKSRSPSPEGDTARNRPEQEVGRSLAESSSAQTDILRAHFRPSSREDTRDFHSTETRGPTNDFVISSQPRNERSDRTSITRGDAPEEAISSAADERSDQFEMTSAAERGDAPDGPIQRDARKTLRELNYDPGDPDALERMMKMHAELQTIDAAKKRIDALKEELVKNAPGPTGGMWRQIGSRIYNFNFPKKTALAMQITRWGAEIRGSRDTSNLSGFIAKQMDRASKPIDWFLQKTGRVGEFGLISIQGGAATAFPSFTAKHFVWGTIFTNVVGAGVTSYLFKETEGSARPPVNTVLWEGWNVAGVALQNHIDAMNNHTDNSAIHQINPTIRSVGNLETRALSDFMAERLDKFQGRNDILEKEIADAVLKSFDDFLAQGGHSTLNWGSRV